MGLIGEENGDEDGEIGMICDLGQDRKRNNREEEEEVGLGQTTASDQEWKLPATGSRFTVFYNNRLRIVGGRLISLC